MQSDDEEPEKPKKASIRYWTLVATILTKQKNQRKRVDKSKSGQSKKRRVTLSDAAMEVDEGFDSAQRVGSDDDEQDDDSLDSDSALSDADSASIILEGTSSAENSADIDDNGELLRTRHRRYDKVAFSSDTKDRDKRGMLTIYYFFKKYHSLTFVFSKRRDRPLSTGW